MTSDKISLLVEFTQRYHNALETLLNLRGRELFRLHGDQTKIVAILQASDGIATFYLPAPADPSIETGCFVYDLAKYDLNRVCQSISVNRLQVAPAFIGEPWDKRSPTFSDVEPIRDFNFPWIHEKIRSAAISGDLNILPGVTISPTVHITEGVRTCVVPGRLKSWSPVFDIPGLGYQRLFLWTHADFWWEHEKLDIDPAQAETTAERDLIAFETLTQTTPLFGVDLAQRDSRTHAADLLEEFCKEFIRILDSEDVHEEVIHQWLNDERHRIFLDPHAKRIWSKLAFGNNVSDFVVRRADDSYKIIEIEPASTRIFKKSDSEPTARFNHACQQVRDWKRYIRDNVQTVRNELGLLNIDDPDGMVVAGRSKDIDGKDAEMRWRDLKATGEFHLFTYDELCDSVRSLADSLRRLF